MQRKGRSVSMKGRRRTGGCSRQLHQRQQGEHDHAPRREAHLGRPEPVWREDRLALLDPRWFPCWSDGVLWEREGRNLGLSPDRDTPIGGDGYRTGWISRVPPAERVRLEETWSPGEPEGGDPDRWARQSGQHRRRLGGTSELTHHAGNSSFPSTHPPPTPPSSHILFLFLFFDPLLGR